MQQPCDSFQLAKEYLNGAAQESYWSRDVPTATLRITVEDLSRFMMMVLMNNAASWNRDRMADAAANGVF